MNKIINKQFILLLIILTFTSQVFSQSEEEKKLIRLTMEATRAENFEVGLEKANEVIKIVPNIGQGYSLRGVIYFKAQKNKEAVADLTKALELGIDDQRIVTTVYKIRGLAHFRLENFSSAVADMTKAIELDDKDENLRAMRARAYRELGIKDLADADDKKVLELKAIAENNEKQKLDKEQNEFEALVDKSTEDFEKKNYAEAIKGFTEIIKTLGDDEESVYAMYYSRGRSYFELKDLEAALADYNKTIMLKPDLASAYTFRGELFSVQEKFDLAKEDFDKAIQLDSKDILALLRRGEVYLIQKEFDKAIVDFDAVLKLDDKYYSAWYWRAESFYNKKKYKKALSDIDNLIKIDPNTAISYSLRALIYRKLGKITEAEIDEKKASELESNN